MFKSLINIVCLLVLIFSASSRTFDVQPAAGTPLKNAIQKARAGDTLRLSGGRYCEGRIIIDKALCIWGELNSVVDGADTSEIFVIKADSVTMRDLTIQNTGNSYTYERAGIRLEFARYCVIEHNTITNTSYAVYSGKSEHCIIRNNIIKSNAQSESSSGNGIHCWHCQGFIIENNVIEQHRDGMYLEFTTETRLTSNESRGNMRYGLHFMFSHHNGYYHNWFHHNGSGVAVMYTNTIEMIGNTFEDNLGDAAYGLLLKEISQGTISNNIFRRNTAGIYAESGGNMWIHNNSFEANGWAMRLMASSTDNRINENNFSSNSFDVATNNYSSYSTFARNYWDKYTGYDLDKNGFGDVPFRPVRLFSTIVEQNSPAMLLMHSFFVSLLDLAESIFPTVTPATMTDDTPSMKPHTV